MPSLIFLRHAETEKDPTQPAAAWRLSSAGEQQAAEVAKDPILQSLDAIYISTEEKTALTAGPLAARLGLTPTASAHFDEVRRGEGFLTPEDFEAEKRQQLTDLSYRAFGGESGAEALKRFQEGVSQIAVHHGSERVLIVSHGTILNLYFADLLGQHAQLPERWEATGFCAYGIVEEGSVVKDIGAPDGQS